MDDRSLPSLSLPRPNTIIEREPHGRILCLVRRRFVALTPEEWVRQHMLAYLIDVKAYPVTLITVERGQRFQGMARRTDALAHDRNGSPLLLVECKAPGIAISQAAFDQVSRYNLVTGAPYVAVTNGLAHYCFKADHDGHTVTFLDDVPLFPAA